MIGLTNASAGGASSNFSYVTAASYANLPPSPSNNTFGLITSTAIPAGGFSIRSKVPSSGMNAGDVVLLTGRDSSKAFEVFSGSKVYAYPIAAYQYVGGVWVSIEAYIYQASAWGAIWVYYFDNGTFSIITGVQYSGNGSFNLNNGLITIDITNNASEVRYESWCFNQGVDVTNYDTLKIAWSAYVNGSQSYGRFYLAATQVLMTSAAFPTASAYVNVISSAAAGSYGGIASVDISGLSGYLKLHGGCYTPATVNRHIDLHAQQIWVE